MKEGRGECSFVLLSLDGQVSCYSFEKSCLGQVFCFGGFCLFVCFASSKKCIVLQSCVEQSSLILNLFPRLIHYLQTMITRRKVSKFCFIRTDFQCGCLCPGKQSEVLDFNQMPILFSLSKQLLSVFGRPATLMTTC